MTSVFNAKGQRVKGSKDWKEEAPYPSTPLTLCPFVPLR
jgi:hypothetical protein